MQHISKEEKLFARVIQRSGRLSSNDRVMYFPIVAYDNNTYYFTLDGQLEVAEMVGSIDQENGTFKILGSEIVYENRKLVSDGKYILLKSILEVECNKFGKPLTQGVKG